MHKIWLIFQREYLVRVRKKSFIIMTLLAPLLLAAFLVIPVLLANISDKTEEIGVLDESGLFQNKFTSTPERKFVSLSGNLNNAKAKFLQSKLTGFLYIPKLNLDNPAGIRLYSKSNASIDNKLAIESSLRNEIENLKFQRSGIDRATLEDIKTDVAVSTTNLSDEGEKDNNAFVTSAAGYASAFLIYIFIFMYGVQIMRGVIEEKTSRIVEVIISSVKPFQLMMGKILGIAAVGLTQFLLWIILSSLVTSVIGAQFRDKMVPPPTTAAITANPENEYTASKKTNAMQEAFKAFDNLNLPLILGSFIFYFLGGYLLYGALFGAVGAAVDNETDTQQFMLPITIPLVMTFVVAQTVIIKNPDGPVAFWMSVIPFTSPIAMMIRIPFGVPTYQLLLSMVLLVLGFIATTWLAARIYRVGILMYGKKVNYKELSKWLFYKV